jgi:SulP family sulfate permease
MGTPVVEVCRTKERSQEQMNALRAQGKGARVLGLQGYIFCSTASRTVETCQSLIRHDGVRYLLLDFRMVQGLDASATLGLTKLEQICSRGGVRLLLSGLRPELERLLRQVQFLPISRVVDHVDRDAGAVKSQENTYLGHHRLSTRCRNELCGGS